MDNKYALWNLIPASSQAFSVSSGDEDHGGGDNDSLESDLVFCP